MSRLPDMLRTQRFDDYRFYHQSTVNQTLHLVSAVIFLGCYALLFRDPALAGLVGVGAPLGLMQAARALPAFAPGPVTEPLGDVPICRVNDAGEPAKGPRRHVRFAYNGTGICTAAVPVAHSACATPG